ncbi:MAG: hypothetical protein ABI415_01830 [Flavitalea sp.]
MQVQYPRKNGGRDRCPLTSKIVRKNRLMVNGMVMQLSLFSIEVTHVTRKVGSEGKLRVGKHNGFITARSKIGEGSIFTISLPLSQPAEKMEAAMSVQ